MADKKKKKKFTTGNLLTDVLFNKNFSLAKDDSSGRGRSNFEGLADFLVPNISNTVTAASDPAIIKQIFTTDPNAFTPEERKRMQAKLADAPTDPVRGGVNAALETGGMLFGGTGTGAKIGSKLFPKLTGAKGRILAGGLGEGIGGTLQGLSNAKEGDTTGEVASKGIIGGLTGGIVGGGAQLPFSKALGGLGDAVKPDAIKLNPKDIKGVFKADEVSGFVDNFKGSHANKLRGIQDFRATKSNELNELIQSSGKGTTLGDIIDKVQENLPTGAKNAPEVTDFENTLLSVAEVDGSIPLENLSSTIAEIKTQLSTARSRLDKAGGGTLTRKSEALDAIDRALSETFETQLRGLTSSSGASYGEILKEMGLAKQASEDFSKAVNRGQSFDSALLRLPIDVQTPVTATGDAMSNVLQSAGNTAGKVEGLLPTAGRAGRLGLTELLTNSGANEAASMTTPETVEGEVAGVQTKTRPSSLTELFERQGDGGSTPVGPSVDQIMQAKFALANIAAMNPKAAGLIDVYSGLLDELAQRQGGVNSETDGFIRGIQAGSIGISDVPSDLRAGVLNQLSDEEIGQAGGQTAKQREFGDISKLAEHTIQQLNGSNVTGFDALPQRIQELGGGVSEGSSYRQQLAILETALKSSLIGAAMSEAELKGLVNALPKGTDNEERAEQKIRNVIEQFRILSNKS